MADGAGLTEYRMAYSDRNGVEELTGPAADARRIQNVLFGHGRAGDSKLGVDIQSYLHEISDPKTLEEIRGVVKRAVDLYCPNVNILQVAVDTLSADQDPTGKKNATLIIGFSLGLNTGGTYDFAVSLRKDSKQNVISSFVL
jgi:hypothetical protein